MFFLDKEWRDRENGIEIVIIHWTSTPLGREPDWTIADQTRVMAPQPATYPVLRRCSIGVAAPSSSTDLLTFESQERTESFLLHHFFEVIQESGTWNTEAFSQEIRALQITQIDPSAECAAAFLYYSLDELKNINRVPMLLEGLPAKYQFLPFHPAGAQGHEDFKTGSKRDELIARLPAPHHFRGQLWGPADARALYTVYFSRQGLHNPFREGGFWMLHDGRPWEVTL
jgi:hypothetical protein